MMCDVSNGEAFPSEDAEDAEKAMYKLSSTAPSISAPVNPSDAAVKASRSKDAGSLPFF